MAVLGSGESPGTGELGILDMEIVVILSKAADGVGVTPDHR